MDTSRKVRGEREQLPWIDHGFTVQTITAWRAARDAEGLPGSLADFYAAHGLCLHCQGHGMCMIGWSPPVNAREIETAQELGLEELPLYGPCQHCRGSGLSIVKLP